MTRGTSPLPPQLESAYRRLRLSTALRCVAAAAAFLLPVAVASWAGAPPGLLAAAGALLIAGTIAAYVHLRVRYDLRWLLRRLDATTATVEDSSDLVLQAPGTLPPMAQLQRARVLQRMAAQDAAAAARLPASRLVVASWAVAAALSAVAVGVLTLLPAPSEPVPVQATDAASELAAQQLDVDVRVQPPAYTGRPARTQSQLDIDVEEGGRVQWSLRFQRAPERALLRFVDGDVLPLTRDGEVWQAGRVITASSLYRVEVEGAPQPDEAGPFRIRMRPDLAPELTVEQPTETLTLTDGSARNWLLRLRARDDHGLGEARLHLTLAQGTGEQVSATESMQTLRGDGDSTQRRYAIDLDLDALGFAAGDDLIARIEVSDLRAPEPNRTQSPALILRWPPPRAGAGSGVDGLVRDAMPAYFRSQRQIIIDTEALIAESPALEEAAITARSDALGVDQRILRLRYGQFLGEEVEEAGAPHAHDGGEAGDAQRSGTAAEHQRDAYEDQHEHGEEHEHGPADEDEHEHAREGAREAHGHDAHAHAEPGSDPASGFGTARGEIAAAGHLHDLPEAATLLDPATRRLLRQALAAMWDAELQLRLGKPADALPHEYRALEAIKRVQQANRIYLARVGLELPPLDFTRRLSGERPPLPPRPDPLQPAPRESPVPEWWRALEGGASLPWDTFARWLRDHEDAFEDALALLADVDRMQRSDCPECRDRLARALWTALPDVPAAPPARVRPDAAGRAWLEALGREGAAHDAVEPQR